MVYKRKLRSGKTDWCYTFDLPGSTSKKRLRVQKTGFATKKEARESEAAKLVEVQKEAEGKVDAPVVRSLRILINEFFEIGRAHV